MTTFTVQVNDNDAEVILAVLKKFKAKVVENPRMSPLTQEIATALKEVKEIQLSNEQPLSLKDI